MKAQHPQVYFKKTVTKAVSLQLYCNELYHYDHVLLQNLNTINLQSN